MVTRSKYRGAIIGTAIGDALGAPMETMWPKDIIDNFPHFTADCIDYVSSPTNAERGIGRWTDDTQLMIPTALSIINMKCVDPVHMAQMYANVYMTERRRGWGRSTTASLQRIAEGVPWEKAAEGSIGTGNGPAMKAAPLGLCLAATLAKDEYIEIKNTLVNIVDVGRITHQDKGVRSGLLQSVLVALAVFGYSSTFIIDALHHSELALFNNDPFTHKVIELCKLDSIPDICSTGGVTSKAEESWCSTASIYLKYCYQKDNCMPVLAELIQQGGDTDTTGAMLGALIGATYGEQAFPKRLRIRLEDSNRITSLGDEIFDELDCDALKDKSSQFSFVRLV